MLPFEHLATGEGGNRLMKLSSTEPCMTGVSHGMGDFHFWMQVLTGDSSDGYSGCKGVGPKAAESILETARKLDIQYYDACLLTYLSAGQTKDELIQSCRLAYIYRKGDDPDKLWEPPEPRVITQDWCDLCSYLGEILNNE